MKLNLTQCLLCARARFRPSRLCAVVANGPIEDLPGYSSDAAASSGDFLDMGELDDLDVDPSSFGPSRPYVNQQVRAPMVHMRAVRHAFPISF
jgi:hypothetical protein